MEDRAVKIYKRHMEMFRAPENPNLGCSAEEFHFLMSALRW